MSGEPGVVVAVLGAAWFAALAWWWRSLKWARAISDTPTHKVQSAPQGYIELCGSARALPDAPVTGELTRTPCVWYRYRVESRVVRDGKAHWQTIANGRSDQNFLLDDGSGTCVIDPDDAEIRPRQCERWSDSGGFGEQRRYCEERIHEGESLYALGFFQTFQAPSREAEAGRIAAEMLREWKRDHDWLLTQFDRNRDGQIDPVEWELARLEASRTALYHVARDYDGEPWHALAKSPVAGQPLIVSTRPQQDLARIYLWQAGAALALFAVVTWALVTWALPRTGWLAG